jgi:catechol-2,3-dioxygenase
MDKAYQHLRAHKIRHASTGPQTIPASNKAAAGIRAFYFKDPDGHNLEIIYFPQGKGDPRWQNANARLFLGIDHTAIVVEDTAQSLKFYRDLLGLKLAGESMNHGAEQEHLTMSLAPACELAASGLKMDLESNFSITWRRKTAGQRRRTRAPTTCGTGKPCFLHQVWPRPR